MLAPFELAPVEGAYTVPVECIEPNPFQPRTLFAPSELAELAQSIEGFGVLQPVVVRPHPRRQGWYQLVSGERRWRASQMAGLETIPVLVRAFNDLEAAEVALQENIQRASLTDFEVAQGVKNLLVQWEAAGVELSNRQLARKLGVSPTFVSNCWKVLGLPPEFLALAAKKRGVKSSLFAIHEVKDATRRQKYLALVKNDASFREVTRAIERDSQGAARRAAKSSAPAAVAPLPRASGVPSESDEAQAQARLAAEHHIEGLLETVPQLSDADFESLVLPLARRIVRGDLAR